MFRTFLIAAVLFSLLAIAIVGPANVEPQATPTTVYATWPVDLGDLKQGSAFGRMELSTGQFTAIGKTQFLIGIAQSGGNIYGIDADNNLVSIDPTNAATKLIGNTGVTSPPGPFGLVVDVFSSLSDGRLFLMDFQNNLFSVDPSTGKASLVGSTRIRPIKEFFLATSLAGDSSSLYFTVHEVSRENLRVVTPPTLYRIDPSTAKATRVGAAPDFVFGSVYAKRTLYGFTREGDSKGPGASREARTNLIITINTKSNTATPTRRLAYRASPPSAAAVVGGPHGILSAAALQ